MLKNVRKKMCFLRRQLQTNCRLLCVMREFKIWKQYYTKLSWIEVFMDSLELWKPWIFQSVNNFDSYSKLKGAFSDESK